MEISEYRLRARQNLTGNWGISIAVALVASLLGVNSSFSIDLDVEDLQALVQVPWLTRLLVIYLAYASVSSIVAFVIGGPVELGKCSFFLAQHDGEKPRFSTLFVHFSNNFGGGFALRLLSGLFTALWSLLFVIPGIVKAYSYSMAPYIMSEHPEWGASECITKSRELMYGHKFDLFLLDLSFLGWRLLCLLTLGIGSIFLNPYVSASYAAFYRDISGQQNVPDPQNVIDQSA